MAQAQPAVNSQQWAKAVAAFARQDSLTPPPLGGIVFTGSSTILAWRTLAADFPNRAVLNRGFGGSQTPDVSYFFEQLIVKYQPRQVVLYEGDNDLVYGQTPDQVYDAFRDFARRMRRELPQAKLLFLAIKPSPSRWSAWPQMKETNRRIRRYCRWHRHQQYADVATPMLGPNGKPRPELYRADSLHMTRPGYEMWTKIVEPYLVK
ncbi:SGNH/GDSL hydrolase family protein [Hymenobacter koreensis]|uniref:SGNH/GDSL hydrolase family protein n=2 Tax=Hymenobacter koreensis TaxID=1084523 RepID=A0ABP8IXB1_9BACT